MVAYRVGAEGATAFDDQGKALTTLKPGTVIVPGTLDTEHSLAAQYDTEAKRRRVPADKRRRVPEDK